MKKIYLFFIFTSIFSFSQTNYQRMWGTYFGCNDFVMQKSILDHDGNIYSWNCY
ncbi:MAG: hypothetical protein H7239_09360 [Flavobacterium sp.]|nr:hypothetical protein [Flavobacterium sp.]